MEPSRSLTKFLQIACRNGLTGQTSYLGEIPPDSRILLDRALDQNQKPPDDIYYFSHEEFEFSAFRSFSYVDREQKKRTINYTKTEIDEYCIGLSTFLRDQTLDFIDYTHDIQYLIGSLNANSVPRKFEKNNAEALLSRLDRINLISILISAKSDFFRYLTEDFEATQMADVSVTKKLFKIYKGIPFLAESADKTVEVEFQSDTQKTIRMPNMLEFIPYTIVENAIKYGPKDMDMEIDIRESGDFILAEISSLGPTLQGNEAETIFNRGVRGQAVLDAGFPGHGLGLYQASKAARELFNGSISVRQDCDRIIELNNMSYCYTTFVIRFPLS